jgi:hypothetical protein
LQTDAWPPGFSNVMPVNHGKGEAAIGLNRLQNGDHAC